MLDLCAAYAGDAACTAGQGASSAEACQYSPCCAPCPDASSSCCECDATTACKNDATVCYDPHCNVPQCDIDYIDSSLTFGVLPCHHPGPACCPDTAHAPETWNGMSFCMPVSCAPDSCAPLMPSGPLSSGGPSLKPHHVGTRAHYPLPWSLANGSDNCGCSLSDSDLAYAQQVLDRCCGPAHAHCTSYSVPCWTPASGDAVPTSIPQGGCVPASMCAAGPLRVGERFATCCLPCVPPHAACPGSSTPSSSTPSLSHTSPQVGTPGSALFCQWTDCHMQLSSAEELAKHLQKLHGATLPSQTQSWDTDLAKDMALEPSGSVRSGAASPWMLDASSPASLAGPLASSAESGPDPFSEAAALDANTACLCPAPEAGQKRHMCRWEHCAMSFDTHAELTAHIAQEHIGSKKTEYECRWEGCERAKEGRTFAQRQKALRHMQTHTGDRPYVCPTCSRRFHEASTLTQHIRTHTRERPYKCDFPGCGKSFSVVGSLTIHKRTHTGDRPFACPYPQCNKRFAESSNLNKHLRVHRGEKPFTCPECGRAFTRPDQMARHRKVHAKAEVVKAPAAKTVSQDAAAARGGASCATERAPPSGGTRPPGFPPVPLPSGGAAW